MALDLARVVGAEVLDGLTARDPAAQRSRRDLQRVHRAMGTRHILLRALQNLPLRRAENALRPLRVLELGAGDGSLMLGVVRELPPAWRPVALTLLDRVDLLHPATARGFADSGCIAEVQVMDALDWAATSSVSQKWDLIVANLFLHHFMPTPLITLLGAIAVRCENFVACEPRRSRLAWAGSHLVGALGANAVTRQDAVLSVHAGFSGQELSALWPAAPGWALQEGQAGWFSHCFVASRCDLAL